MSVLLATGSFAETDYQKIATRLDTVEIRLANKMDPFSQYISLGYPGVDALAKMYFQRLSIPVTELIAIREHNQPMAMVQRRHIVNILLHYKITHMIYMSCDEAFPRIFKNMAKEAKIKIITNFAEDSNEAIN